MPRLYLRNILHDVFLDVTSVLLKRQLFITLFSETGYSYKTISIQYMFVNYLVFFLFLDANHFPFIASGIINLTNMTVTYLDVCPYFSSLLLSTIEEPFTNYQIIVTGWQGRCFEMHLSHYGVNKLRLAAICK